MNKDDRPSDYTRPEDWLCALGIAGGFLVGFAASWTANHDTATALIANGGEAVICFVILWIISKIIRAIAERDSD